MQHPAPDDLLRAALGAERTPPPDHAALAEHFPDLEILACIGQGGMGAVYRVLRRADGKLLALKVMRPVAGKEQAFTARFACEAEALERLHHPNIVAIHGHGQGGPWCWLLMDLVEGANLREIATTGRLSPAQTLALVPPLCAALQYAHDHGVVHRDLKPENILLDAAGVPHLVDFGLAKLRDSAAGSGLTNTGAGMGTLHYMAPEQVANAKDVDHRADIYALGVVIYELLTGQLPLGRFEAPSQRVQVDVRIDEVVLKALERDPERRWQHMRQVGKAVTDLNEPTAPSSHWKQVNRAAALGASLYCLLTIIVLAYPQPDMTWQIVTLATLALLLSGWAVAVVIYQGRTRTLWLMSGVLVGLCVTTLVMLLMRHAAVAEHARQSAELVALEAERDAEHARQSAELVALEAERDAEHARQSAELVALETERDAALEDLRAVAGRIHAARDLLYTMRLLKEQTRESKELWVTSLSTVGVNRDDGEAPQPTGSRLSSGAVDIGGRVRFDVRKTDLQMVAFRERYQQALADWTTPEGSKLFRVVFLTNCKVDRAAKAEGDGFAFNFRCSFPLTSRPDDGATAPPTTGILSIGRTLSFAKMTPVDEQLAATEAVAEKIVGKERLEGQVARLRAINMELRTNVAKLKAEAGFRRDERFKVPPTENEKGKFFLNHFVDVRQALREKAQRQRIESDERLGFPPDDKVPPAEEAQTLLDMLQLTEKALNVVLSAPDPVEWFDITHGKPYDTGPVSRPPLLKEYPLTLKLRCSLKTVMWILDSLGAYSEGGYPVIVRGLTITSTNNLARDDDQQLEVRIELAGMDFLADSGRVSAEAPPKTPGQ